ncbi:MAG: flagellar hook-associated protein FlgK [Ideonella sp.]|nr:flagellar hook-associated protein FlgK [Ideonella sp.]MCC7457852.1 flagellar hook-associated protein FlgK [Nitrospira sp.]
MSVSGLMSIGMRAMFANYAGLQTTGHNIANASVEGYSRQQVDLQTALGQFTGNGYIGKGVDVKTIQRAYDQFLTRELNTSNSQAQYDSMRLERLQQLEMVFAGGDEGIGAATGAFLNSMVDVASTPQDLAARNVVLGRAGELAQRFHSAALQLDGIQQGVTLDLQAGVASVNSIARQIAQVNNQIAAVKGNGQPPNDLLDLRDQLLSKLSDFTQITTMAAADGSMSVFIGGGQQLVLGNQAAQLVVGADTFDPSRVAVGLSGPGGVQPLSASLLGGGSIGALLHFQGDDLVRARTLLGQLSAAAAGSLNGQQALGLDLHGNSGGALFTVGLPQALPASSNARGGGGAFVANVTLTVTDAAQLRASEYSLANDGTGWQLVRLSDGATQAVVDGSVVDGFRIDLGTPAPAPTDRFLLQPVSRAANSMTLALTDASGLAAASPVTATAAGNNTGTGAVASLQVVSTAVDPNQTATVTFTSAAGAYNWELRDRVTNALLTSGSGTWSGAQPIALNGFELNLTGAPAAGDVFTVAKTAFPAASNGNAVAFVNLRDGVLVGRVGNGGGGLTGGSSLTDAWSQAMADIGVRTQGAHSASAISSQVAESAKATHSQRTGVNLDEEAARLLQYQQGYQAAAKVLQVAQTVFDSLLDAAGR